MATETVTPTAPEADDLNEFARAHAEELFDALALLSSVAERIEAAQSGLDGDPMHTTLRLAYLARDKVAATAAAVGEHI